MTSQRFPCQPEAVTAARRFVRDALVDQPLEITQAAELMASELATNCVRHARTDFELVIHSQGQIRIEVRDTGEGRPTPLAPSARELSGRGLLIVEAMSDAWGVIPARSGKTVWFTLPQRAASGGASRSAASSPEAEGGGRRAEGSEQPDQLASGQLEARARECAREREGRLGSQRACAQGEQHADDQDGQCDQRRHGERDGGKCDGARRRHHFDRVSHERRHACVSTRFRFSLK
jgi:anti-sigma regulatory factor (Ser/Thr protein kinase)